MATQSGVASTMRSKGFAMTLTQTTAGAYDPVTGFSGSISKTYTVYGVVGNYGIGEFAKANGTTIQIGDKKATIGAGVVVPGTGDTLMINGEVWRVVMVDVVNPQGVDLLYKLQLRK